MQFLGIISLILGCVSDNVIEKQDNAVPAILITSHSDGFALQEGYAETFRATASDEDHNLDELSVIWYVGEEVACDWATVEPDGTSSCDIVFNSGDETVIAEVRDPTGAAGISEISVSVLPTEAPVVTLLTPIAGQNYYSDQLIQFSAAVSDTEDDAQDLVVLWSSSLDGELELDTTVDSNGELSDHGYLTEGEHAIELRVEDTTGKFSTEEVVIQVSGQNNVPDCEITQPADDAAFVLGDMITFRGTAVDSDIPNNDLVIEWVSDKDGSLGFSTATSAGDITFSYDELSADSHTISLNVSDEVGEVCTAQVLVHIGSLPVALIAQPLDGEIFSVGAAISFLGTATDQEDQPNELSVVWTSSLDGVLETGTVNSQNISEFTSDTLKVGLHSLRFTVTDSVGLIDEDSVSFRVNTPPTVDSLQISPDPLYANNQLSVTATGLDADGHPVTLSYAWLENGQLTSFTGTTIPASEFAVGELWTVRVTPNDGYVNGIYAETSITVSNTAPTLTEPTISSSTGLNVYNSSVLTCSSTAFDFDESVTETYSWEVNGNTYIGATLDLSTTGAFPEDVVTCTVSVSDSNGGFATDFVAVEIDNRTPMVDSMTISPDPTYWDQDMTIEATFVDFDGDEVTASYAWYEEGVLTSYTGDTIPASALEAGEEWTVYITPNDGHEDGNDSFMVITIDNHTPSVDTVVITPNTDVTTGTELVCSGIGSDPEDGSLAPTYEWYVNANLLGSTDTLQLDNSMVSPSDWVECVARVSDSLGATNFAVGLAQVENTNPTIDSSSLTPSAVTPLDTVTCSATASDIDGDTPTLSFVFNNLTTSATHSPTSATVSDATLDLSTIGINPNEQLACLVTATDADGGQISDSVSTTMEWDTPTISVTVSHSNLGSFYAGDLLSCSGTASDYAGNDLTSQIQYQWINRSNGDSILSATTDYTIDASQVDVGDILECVGTITDSLGEVAAASQNNVVVSVNNSQPFFTVTPELSDYSLYHGDTVTCAAAFSDPDDPNLSELWVDYQWVIASMADQVIATGTDTYTVDLNEIEIGDELRCHVILQDAFGETAFEFSPNATIENAPPVLTTPVITPNTGVVMGTELTCSATATDAETGAITPGYQWMVGNTTIAASNTYTVDSSVNIGDTLTCQVEAHDGHVGVTDTASVLIENIDPTVSDVGIFSPSGMFYNDELVTCTATTDDADSTPVISYSWDSGGVNIGSSQTLDLGTVTVLPAASLTCTVTADDGYAQVFDSATETIGNRAPSAPTATISWSGAGSSPTPDDDLSCVGSDSVDPDDEAVNYSYAWSSDAGGSVSGDTLTASETSDGETWTCTVTATDGNLSAEGEASVLVTVPISQRSWADCPTDQLISDADVTFTGENLGDQAGYSVANAGDVDGDGLDDILIGAYMNDAGGGDAGKAYLILRSSLGASSSIDLSTADYEFIGENSGDYAGYTVSGAGDVDGDGLGDFLIGAYYGNSNGGRAYLILGGSLGGTSSIDLSNADYIFNAVNTYDRASSAMAPAGDVDGDGLDDFLIGAYGDDSGATDAGGAYLILGGSLGNTSTLSLSSADYHFLGEVAGDKAGVTVSGAGDVDGDGLDDILVGAPYNDENGNDAGKGYLILGSSLGATASFPLADADYTFLGEDLLDYAGRSMAPAGDVDGDGLDDLIIAAYGDETAGANNSGKIYLLLGSALGSNPVIDLATDPAYEFLSEGVDEYAGLFVSSAGDMDDDGFPDILISAPYYDGTGWNFGKVYAILAASLGSTKTISLSSADYTFLGEGDGDVVGYTLAVLEGGDAPEILFGAPSFTGSSMARGHAFLYTPCEASACGQTECDLGLDLGNSQIMDFALIPAGSDPLGRYDISQNFYMMTTEVTQGQFYELMGYYPHTGQNFITGEGDNYAVYYANWHMAADFANMVTLQYNVTNGTALSECYTCSSSGTTSVSCAEAISALTCDGFRLPTSAEWEYAGRSGTQYDFWTADGGGDYSSTNCNGTETIQDSVSNPLIGNYAHYCGNNSPAGVKEVAGLLGNLWGLYDMHGNVREWVADKNGCVFPASANNPLCISGSDYILRGGTFTANGYGLSFGYTASAATNHLQDNIGFRLAFTE